MSKDTRFGEIIENACREHGVSLKELSRALGRTQPWAIHVVRGKNMTERVFKECLWALDLDLEIKLVPRRKNDNEGTTPRRAARKAASVARRARA